MHVKVVYLIGLLTLGVVQGKPSFCREQACPRYTTTYSRSYDIREYGETKWVATQIRTSKPYCSTSQLRGMFSIVWPYYNGENAQKTNVGLAVPGMTRVEKIRNGLYNVTFMLYLPGNPPPPTDRKVFLVTKPAGQVYVSDFTARRWPRDSTFASKAKDLKKKIKNNGLYDPDVFYRVSYNYPFDRTKKHHEVWLDKM